MISPQMIKIFEKQNKLNQTSLLKMGFRKPHISSKLLYERIKFALTKKPTHETVKLFFGEKMHIVLPERVSEFLYYFKFFETGQTKFLLEYLKPGMIFADVGAHFGYFTLLSLKIVGESGQVHSFEPTKSTSDILSLNSKSTNQYVNNVACCLKIHL